MYGHIFELKMSIFQNKIIIVYLILHSSLCAFGEWKFEVGSGGAIMSGQIINYENGFVKNYEVVLKNGSREQLKLYHSIVKFITGLEKLVNPYIGVGCEYSFNEGLQRTLMGEGYDNIIRVFFLMHNLRLYLNLHFLSGQYDPYIFLTGGYGMGQMESQVVTKQIIGYPLFNTYANVSGIDYGIGLGFSYSLFDESHPHVSGLLEFIGKFYVGLRVKYIINNWNTKPQIYPNGTEEAHNYWSIEVVLGLVII